MLDQCWEWAGCTTSGYGVVRWKGKTCRVHRLTYEALVGPIPDGLTIDHLCRNTRCYNPRHLEPVTRRENTLRQLEWLRKSPTCKRGHPWDEANTYTHPTRGYRVCRRCHADRQNARNARERAAT